MQEKTKKSTDSSIAKGNNRALVAKNPDRYCGLKAVNALKRRKIPFGIFSRFCGHLRIRTADPLLVRQML